MNIARKNPTPSPSVDLSVLKCFETIQIEDEPDVIVELIDLYLEDVPRRFEIMRSASSEADRSAVQRQAHSVKGSSGTLGVLGIAQICDRIERLEFGGPKSSLPVLMDQLEHEFAGVRVMLLEERQRRNWVKVLIAEDDPVSSLVLTKTLTKWGHEVVATINGSEALRALQKEDDQ